MVLRGGSSMSEICRGWCILSVWRFLGFVEGVRSVLLQAVLLIKDSSM